MLIELWQRFSRNKLLTYPWVLQMHGFYLDMENKYIRFDVVINFEQDSDKAVEIINKDIKKMYPEYTIVVATDLDTFDIV